MSVSSQGRAGGGASTQRPMNVEQIVREAQNFKYDPRVPLKYWLRSADVLLKEAEIYEREGNEQRTYLLLFRHAELVLRNLTKHPDARAPPHRPALERAEREVVRSLGKLEALKPRLNRAYEQHRARAAERARRLGPRAIRKRTPTPPPPAALLPRPAGDEGATSPKRHKTRGPEGAADAADAAAPAPAELPAEAPPPEPAELAAGDHRDFAVRLAHTELRRRALARKATRQAGIPAEVELQRRTAGVWGDWEAALSHDAPPATGDGDGDDGDALSRDLQSVRAQVEGRQSPRASPPPPVARNGSTSSSSGPRPGLAGVRLSAAYRYPSVPGGRSNGTTRTPSPARTEPPARGLVSLLKSPPLVPPKEDLPGLAPPRPAKQPLAELESPLAPPASAPPDPGSALPPAPSASPPPATDGPPATPADAPNPGAAYTFKASAALESGAPLRTLFLPPDLRARFLALAAPATRANRETCGILCGTLIANALFVSRLVLPEQTGTSDTCEMRNESRLFDYVDGEDLLVLGWIHTHPTQTCFMSSRDLHTHCGYQVMLPESVAVVCAPSKNEWGVFRLTDPPGMQSILNCTQTGLFHPHAEDNIYTDALKPGHVFEAKGLEFDVHDMRDS